MRKRKGPHFWPYGMPVTCTWWNSCDTNVGPLNRYVCACAQQLLRHKKGYVCVQEQQLVTHPRMLQSA